ncbi:hypothetical protein CMT52_10540 [Elizabethkingia anophelis]|nr:hypothetical protein [Elizabethkingia anophelis]MDV3925981.1 hypothetical protein [Elizabethkingia anophelis]MDV4024773.1 hypothetical protein [Elizabethkingia anophelis]
MDYKYIFLASSSIRVEEILSQNNRTGDAMFWSELFDDNLHQSFYFSSLALNSLTDENQIIKRAYQIISIFEGIFKLCERRSQRYFNLDALYDNKTKKLIAPRISEPEIYLIDFDISKLKNSTNTKTFNPTYDLFSAIIEYKYLTNLFFLLSKKIDYRLLYMIYDDIKFFLHENNDMKFLKEFESELKIFTNTANNYEILGYFARHGRTKQVPPRRTITLEKSMDLIFNIIEKLLKDKFNLVLPRL